jgi:hypothetical protein
VSEPNPYTSTRPDEPCKCGKQRLRSWWEAITDAGDEGTDRVRHTRASCLTETERRIAKMVVKPTDVRVGPEEKLEDARRLLNRAQARLAEYRLGCPCPGEPCVTDCKMCDTTQGLVNEIRALLAPTPTGVTA